MKKLSPLAITAALFTGFKQSRPIRELKALAVEKTMSSSSHRRLKLSQKSPKLGEHLAGNYYLGSLCPLGTHN